MGLSKISFFSIFTIILVVTIGVLIGFIIQSSNIDPPVLENTWWGPGKPGKDNTAIIPFKIAVSDEVLQDLQNRLKTTRPFTPPLEGVAQEYGMNSNLLQEIVDFWKTKYDWKEREKLLNKHSQFKTQIQGLNIHYFHVKPTNTKKLKILPLLLLHGWPGSVKEFQEIMSMITTHRNNQDFNFEVIVPSLPGFGFSQGAARSGLGAAQMAVVFKNLMQRLGFEKFYVHGGDWGSIIATNMGALFKDHILGIHLNGCMSNTLLTRIIFFMGSLYPPLIVESQHEAKMYPLSTYFHGALGDTGYLHIQATKPDTVGFGLNDSPVGLAAYILEKFTTWTNPHWRSRADGGLKIKYKYEDLLDNVMIYWITNSITTSVRLYAETLNVTHFDLNLENVAVKVPTACAKMEYELMYQPDHLLKHKFHNLVQTNYYEGIGHFSSFEEPRIVVDDIWSAIGKMENAV